MQNWQIKMVRGGELEEKFFMKKMKIFLIKLFRLIICFRRGTNLKEEKETG
jgi:hypothetical protein